EVGDQGAAHPIGGGIGEALGGADAQRGAGAVPAGQQGAAGGPDGDVGGGIGRLGAGAAKGADGDMDDARVDGLYLGGGRPPGFGALGVRGVDKEIGGGDQAGEQAAALFGIGVANQAALAGAVGRPEQGVVPGGRIVGKGADPACGGARRRLDLDDIGTQ